MRIYNCNCLDVMEVSRPGSVDLVVTSPPYDDLRTYNGNNADWGSHVWKPCIQRLYTLLKEGGVCVWIVKDASVHGSETGTSFRQALWAMDCGFNLHDTMFWQKPHLTFPTKNRYHDCISYMFIFSNNSGYQIGQSSTDIGKMSSVN